MNANAQCKIRIADDLSVHCHEYIFLLYKPLMGAAAAELFEILCALASSSKALTLEDVLTFSGMNEGMFLQARKKLEQYSLLVSYCSEDENAWEFHLYNPRTPKEFLRHEVFGRMMINKFPAERFEKIKEIYDLDYSTGNLRNVSQSMKADELEDEWSQQKETVLQLYIPPSQELARYPFNWEVFFKGMRRVFPTRLRTKQNMVQIAYLAHMFGLSEENIRKYVVRGMRENNSYIDFDYVMDCLMKTVKTKPAWNDPEKASPVLYLKSLQPEGTEILQNERRLLLELSASYQFSDEVINTLIEYCLNACNHAFVDNYIKKVANTWKRAKVDTRKKALDFIAQDSRKPAYKNPGQVDTSLPDWYSKTEKKPASDELYAQAMALQKELRDKKDGESV